MDFYTSISKYYDFIFPYSPAQVKFVKQHITQGNILDIGCGTGNLSIGLHEAGYKVKAIDYDGKMIEKARAKNQEIDFREMNMLDIYKNYKENNINGIVSFGNTLVHLLKDEEIESFLDEAYKTLEDNGFLGIQILNYQNIIENKIESLPLIENESIKFERTYEFREDNLINFVTKLSIKEDNQEIENRIQLNPIYWTRLKEMMLKAGFSDVKVYGNFKMDRLEKNSFPLLMCGYK
jgi:ubiquinone/menaquinone biosynthesis C-methylase UbiE